MTGRDLIIYILSNNLEDEPVFKDGKWIGFLTVEEAAVKLGVGTPTIYAMILQKQLDAISIGSDYIICPYCERFGGINE